MSERWLQAPWPEGSRAMSTAAYPGGGMGYGGGFVDT